MIKDHVRNAAAYRTLGRGMAGAMDYLQRTDLRRVPLGRHEIDGDRVFVIVQRSRLKPLAEATWESHRRYIDVQCVIEGRERMGHTMLEAGFPVSKDYDPATDLIFYDVTGDLFDVRAGEFAVFTPQDVHAPSLQSDGPDVVPEVLKAIIKVRVDGPAGACGF